MRKVLILTLVLLVGLTFSSAFAVRRLRLLGSSKPVTGGGGSGGEAGSLGVVEPPHPASMTVKLNANRYLLIIATSLSLG